MIFMHFRWSSVLWTRSGSYSPPFPLTAYSLIHRPGLLASDEGFEVASAPFFALELLAF